MTQRGVPTSLEQFVKQTNRDIAILKRQGRGAAILSLQERIEQVKDEAGSALVPTAPVELVGDTSLYMNRDGVWRGRAIIQHPPVTKATTGEDITVDSYEIWYRLVEFTERDWILGGTFPNSTGLRVDDLTPAATYEFYSRAIGAFGTPGISSEPIELVVEKDTTPPRIPSPGSVTNSYGTLIYTWDGTFSSGTQGPDPDLAWVRLEISTDNGATWDDTGHHFNGGAQSIPIPGLPYGETVFFRTVAVDTSDNESPPSQVVFGTPQGIVDEDLILTTIEQRIATNRQIADEAKTAAENAESVVAGVSAWIDVQGAELQTKVGNLETDLGNAEDRLEETFGLAERALNTGGSNATPRGSMEVDTLGDAFSGWSATGNFQIVDDATQAYQGSKFLRYTAQAGVADWAYLIDEPPVTEGRQYLISMAARLVSGSPTGNRTSGMAPTWFNHLNQSVNRSAHYPSDLWLSSGMLAGLTSEWKVFTGISTVPPGEGVVRMRPRLYFNADALAPGSVMDIDAITITEVTPNEGISGVDISKLLDGGTLPTGVAEKIAAVSGQFLTIDVAQLNVASVANLKQVVADAMWTKKVSAKKVLANEVLIGGSANLITDPYFDDASMRNVRAAQSDFVATWGFNASINRRWYGGSEQPTTRTKNFYYYLGEPASVYDTSTYITVEPGEVYKFSAVVNSSNGAARWTYRLIRADGSTNYNAVSLYDSGTGVRTITGQLTIPADVRYILPAIQFNAEATAAYVYGGAIVEKMVDANLVVDGTIKARHIDLDSLEASTGFVDFMRTNVLVVGAIDDPVIIADNTITARTIVASEELSSKVGSFLKVTTGMLQANTIEGGHIKGGAINGTHITGTAIDGKTITGATFQTSTTFPKVLLDSAGLRAMSNSSTKKFDLNASTGIVTIHDGSIVSPTIEGGVVEAALFTGGEIDIRSASGVPALRASPLNGVQIGGENVLYAAARAISSSGTTWTIAPQRVAVPGETYRVFVLLRSQGQQPYSAPITVSLKFRLANGTVVTEVLRGGTLLPEIENDHVPYEAVRKAPPTADRIWVEVNRGGGSGTLIGDVTVGAVGSGSVTVAGTISGFDGRFDILQAKRIYDQTLPDPIGENGATTNVITASSWSNLPGGSLAITFNAPHRMLAFLVASGVFTFGAYGMDARAGIQVTGASSLSPSEPSWSQTMWGRLAASNVGGSDIRSMQVITPFVFNPGSNTVRLMAYAASGSANFNYPRLEIVPLRWA